ncbi:hypothetical protein GCM10023189_43080 [Nibrella saemangeumensis]|uniref:Major capsid protein n=1 Tax=Nibrella saemangeumensis TaxID=1084526 RepID=A0ABP8NDS3_9BACT
MAANDVNLGLARIMRAAIMHTAENGMRFEEIGTLQAMSSPQLLGLKKAMSAEVADGEKRLSIEKGPGGVDDIIPVIRLNYKQQYVPAETRNTRQVVDGGEEMKDPVELDVRYNNHREYDHKFYTLDLIKLEGEARRYLARNMNGFTQDVGQLGGLIEVGSEILSTIEQGLLVPINTSVLSALIAGIGGNLMYGKTAPANLALPNIPLFNTDGTARKDFWQWINLLKRIHKIKGKLIVVGGKLLVKFMEDQKVASMNDIILNQQAMYNTLAVEWYYDPQIDITYGPGKIILMDAGAACMQTILEHEYIVKQKKVANTSFSSAAVQIAQYDSGSFAMRFDIRAREYDTGKYPYFTVTPSAHWGTFVRPAGYHKLYGGWDTVTGIYGAQLVETLE